MNDDTCLKSPNFESVPSLINVTSYCEVKAPVYIAQACCHSFVQKLYQFDNCTYLCGSTPEQKMRDCLTVATGHSETPVACFDDKGNLAGEVGRPSRSSSPKPREERYDESSYYRLVKRKQLAAEDIQLVKRSGTFRTNRISWTIAALLFGTSLLAALY